ncbi:MAG: SGNH/GDSL hydrolase family protein, partial [Lentisphaeria bacterium]|nr:SGNH/GDSL hydrolase family protein [Lentisphaeria bacterium]
MIINSKSIEFRLADSPIPTYKPVMNYLNYFISLPRCLILLGAMIVASSLSAQEKAAIPAFKKGDRICFFGDSIFHGGQIEADVLLFYATRFPDAPLEVINCGVAGDMASRAIPRLDWDLKARKPNVTVLMLGMNDVGRWLYGKGKDTPAIAPHRTHMLKKHFTYMDRIINEIKAMNSKVIVCTPTPYDQTTKRKSYNIFGVNDALGLCAENIYKKAGPNKWAVVDFYALMNRVSSEQQAKDPNFTMMGAGRVHPLASGHLLMTYALLKAQGISPYITKIVLDSKKAIPVETINCTLFGLKQTENSMRFDYLSKALPFPISNEHRVVLDWVPFMADLNQELLQVKNLQAGNYALL